MNLETIDSVDYTMIGVFFLLNISLVVLLTQPIDKTAETVGDWYVLLTHLLILPTLMLSYKIRWFFFAVLQSLVASVVYHYTRVYDFEIEPHFASWDVATQNILMFCTLALLVYDTIPQDVFLGIIACGTFIAAVGDVEIGPFEVFEFFGAVAMVGLLVYLVYLSLYPDPNRHLTHIVIATIASTISGVAFLLPNENFPEKYPLEHSIWHVSAYTMLYFIVKSIVFTPSRIHRFEMTPLSTVDEATK